MTRFNWNSFVLTAAISAVILVHGQAGLAASLSKHSQPSNTAPTISGTPARSVTVLQPYSFRPTAKDSQNSKLTFSVTNKPAWAQFSSSSGTLSGTPSTARVGTYANIIIRVSDGRLSAALPAFTITVNSMATPPVAPNTAPVIAGAPATSVPVGTSYSFIPAASDADGNTLGFSISGKPAWATFSVATGALTGTAQGGTYANIVISVSDGTVSRALPAFTLTVTQPDSGIASLIWSAPTENTDGSPLTDLAGYRVYHGTSASALNDIVQVSGAGNTSYAFRQLASGTHYFAVAAYTNAGIDSALSAVGSKTIQ